MAKPKRTEHVVTLVLETKDGVTRIQMNPDDAKLATTVRTHQHLLHTLLQEYPCLVATWEEGEPEVVVELLEKAFCSEFEDAPVFLSVSEDIMLPYCT